MLAKLRCIHPLLMITMVSAAALGSAGCASKTDPTGDSAGTGASGGSGVGTAADSGISPTSANVVYAKGWLELDLNANSAKNSVDTAGHFHTDHNMCQQQGDGVYDLVSWNKMSTTLNQVVSARMLTTPRCWESPNNSKFFNPGLALIALDNGTPGLTAATAPRRQLYEFKNGQICTTIEDATLAGSLMNQIENTLLLVDRADAEACPNYHPPVPGHLF